MNSYKLNTSRNRLALLVALMGAALVGCGGGGGGGSTPAAPPIANGGSPSVPAFVASAYPAGSEEWQLLIYSIKSAHAVGLDYSAKARYSMRPLKLMLSGAC